MPDDYAMKAIEKLEYGSRPPRCTSDCRENTRKTSEVSDDVLDDVLRSMRRTIKNYTPYFPPSILKKIRKWERMLSSMKE